MTMDQSAEDLNSLVIPAGALLGGVKYRWNLRAFNSAGWKQLEQ